MEKEEKANPVAARPRMLHQEDIFIRMVWEGSPGDS